LLLDPSSKLFIIAFTLSFPKQNGTMPKNVSSVFYSMFLQVTKNQKMVDWFLSWLDDEQHLAIVMAANNVAT